MITSAEPCPRCEKPADLCVCDVIAPVGNRTRVLILQHPQEPDKEIGSARIAKLALGNAELRVGLSWPNLKKAWGSDTIPSEWLVLYLGSAKLKAVADGPLVLLDKAQKPLADRDRILSKVRGVVVLDGTWAQAKTMWWRNPWLTKLQRGFLVPERRSLYGNLRKEPRRESLSTIESIAMALDILERDPAKSELLLKPFKALLERYRARR